MNKNTKKAVIGYSCIFVVLIVLLIIILNVVNRDDSDTSSPTPQQPPAQTQEQPSESPAPAQNGQNQGSRPTGIIEIDFAGLGQDFTETEVVVTVSDKTALFLQNQLFFALKMTVVDEEMMWFVNINQFLDIRVGDRFTAVVRTYRTSAGTPVRSIISMRQA
jgi:hypothetical protein